MKVCPKCNQTKTEDSFYIRPDRDSKQTHSYCKECVNIQTRIRQHEFKKQCIDYKGGKCSICGYDKCQASLEFHHIDPNQKDKNFGNLKLRKWEDQKKELDKCICVCANCHREIHAELRLDNIQELM